MSDWGHQHLRLQPVSNYRLSYLRHGDGRDKVVLLIHGGGTWLYSFRHLFAPLAETGFTVVALDMPGHGWTRANDGFRPDYSLAMMTRVIAEFLDSQKFSLPVHLVGNSWGGGWALRFAQVFPERVASLSLLAASGFRHPEVWLYESLRYPLVGELSTWLVNRTTARSFYRRAFFNPALVSETMVDEAYAPISKNWENRRAQYRLMRNLDWHETEARMIQTQTPTLVLWGKQDRLWPVSLAQRFANQLPKVRLEVFDHCGHLPHEEMPEATLHALSDFWSNL